MVKLQRSSLAYRERTTPHQCNTPINSSRACVLTSTNYPKKYPDNMRGEHILDSGSDDRLLRLRFTDFNLESSDRCSHDFVEIMESDDTALMEKTCGDIIPEEMYSKTRQS